MNFIEAMIYRVAAERIQKERDYRMRFGKHKGKKLEDVPADYLFWVSKNVENLDDILKGYIEDNYSRLEREGREMSEDWKGEGYGAEWWKD